MDIVIISLLLVAALFFSFHIHSISRKKDILLLEKEIEAGVIPDPASIDPMTGMPMQDPAMGEPAPAIESPPTPKDPEITPPKGGDF